jgi:type VII secretion-associated protein (TIGR03931 family)
VSGSLSRVAVQLGAHTVRIAGAAADGEPRLVAEWPGGGDVAELLIESVGRTADELVLVHPASWPPPRVHACGRELAGFAERLRTLAVPVAAAGVRPCVVLDIGRRGTEITRLAANGTVRLLATVPIGGDHLDGVVAGWLRTVSTVRSESSRVASAAGPESSHLHTVATRIRERLSLHPGAEVRLPGAGHGFRVSAADLRRELADPLCTVVELLSRTQARDGPVPVLLIGGVARTPLLAELVDAAGFVDAAVAPVPEAAAVLGALRATAMRDGAGGAASCGRGPPVSSGSRPAGPAGAGDGVGSVGSRFPPPPRRPVRTAVLGTAGAGLAAALLALGTALAPAVAEVAVPAGTLAQYGYRFDLPAGWEHTGGLPQRRRVLLTPSTAPEGNDVIAVERTPLGYDGSAERERALAELRAEFDAAVAGGSVLSDFGTATVAGREVVRYRQRDAGGRSEVDWFVVIEGDAQFSIGCRHNPAAAALVRAACATVIGSVRRA